VPDVRKIIGGSLGAAVAQRMKGERPGAMRALAGATVAGTATAVVVYRVLRPDEEEAEA
jgi:hypothetical protein